MGASKCMAAGVFFWVFLVSTCPLAAAALDGPSHQLLPGQSVSATRILQSSDGSFSLGFFRPGASKGQYLGLRHRVVQERILWVANRQAPVSDNGALTLTADGRLVISDGPTDVWSTTAVVNVSISSPMARLMDNGNLVVVDRRDNNTHLWQSFDHPTDMLLPDMRIGTNRRTGVNTNLTSWTSNDDPAPGNYTLLIDVQDVPQLVLYRGSSWYWRIGPWVGKYFTGSPGTAALAGLIDYNYTVSKDEVSFSFHITDGISLSSSLVYLAVNISGEMVGWTGTDETTQSWTRPIDKYCSNYERCGANSICHEQTRECDCVKGFQPPAAARGKCSRKTPELGCRAGGRQDHPDNVSFLRLSHMVLPDTKRAAVKDSMNPKDCRLACASNCSCTAYANASGCLRWFTDLADLKTIENSDGVPDLYVRAAEEQPTKSRVDKKKNTTAVAAAAAGCACAAVGIVVILCCLWRRKNRRKRGYEDGEELDVPILDFDGVAAATGNFCDENKLGKGGFGSVHKGTLTDGQDVAVKRLSAGSSQGLKEFKNEVQLIAKLQHRNLVRLVACCVHGEERMLIYEYMPNKSLDYFLFGGAEVAGSLDWRLRYRIVNGIARGMLYLHQDSRLRIIHRDLKASNVLLDADMNPKISDFGLARIFGGDDADANSTIRVVGTYGYMSPEYALYGVFSVKSDVFSFGVLVLEIVSGVRSKAAFEGDPTRNLVGHAWELWSNGGNVVHDLADRSIQQHTLSEDEVQTCVKIGLLCVQGRPEDRPSMSSVVAMLGGNVESLPEPREPGYVSMGPRFDASSSSTGKGDSRSVNDLTITTYTGR